MTRAERRRLQRAEAQPSIVVARRRRTRVLFWLLAVLVSLFFVFPFLWALVTSLKPPTEAFNDSVIPFLQFDPTLQNWSAELSDRSDVILKGLTNSTIAASLSSLICVTLGTFAGYSLARSALSEKRTRSVTDWLLSQRFLLPVVVVIPYLLSFRALGLIDNVFALVIAYSVFNLPLAVLVMKDFIADVPVDLEEAAMTDGASQFQAFRTVVLPIVIPGMIATFILVAAFAWNEFLFALALTYKNATTMPVVIIGAQSTRGAEFWYIAVRSLIATVPPVLLVMFVQRYIVRGLSMGAVKG